MSMMILKEHSKPNENDEKLLKELTNSNNECSLKFEGHPKNDLNPKYLGLNQFLEADFYIGICWLNKEHSLMVKPKLDNIDFAKMFSKALCNMTACEYFANYYGIDFESKMINLDDDFDLITPLLVIHYLSVLENLIKRGLKRDYILKEKNLHLKIKGKIVLAAHLKKNIFNNDYSHNYCVYSEYTEDNIVNRLLKKALLFVKNYLSSANLIDGLITRLNKVLFYFDNVSDDIQLSMIKNIKFNKVYKDYSLAVKLAKMILKRYGYSIDNVGSQTHLVPPFWIDMPRLYEVYVLGLLEEKFSGTIKFQFNGSYGTKVDFIKTDEKLIMDAKYKPRYNDSNRRIIDDIREISGYARDAKIRKEIGVGLNEIVKCIIIYPNNNENYSIFDSADLEGINSTLQFFTEYKCDKIKSFVEFYKTSIDLPLKI